jgi:hypothetical protein
VHQEYLEDFFMGPHDHIQEEEVVVVCGCGAMNLNIM